MVATLLRGALDPVLGPTLQFITYFPALFISSVYGGFGPTLLATVLSAILAEYLFFLPRRGFDLSDLPAMAGLGVFALVGIAMAWLGETRLKARGLIERARTEARRQELTAEKATAAVEKEMVRAESEASRALLALEASRRAQERTHAILESTTDNYMGVDADWRITYVNTRAAETFAAQGLDAQSLIGRTIWEVWPDLLGTEVERQYRRIMSERSAGSFENWHASGKRWYEIRGFPLPKGGLGIFFLDITGRKQFEARLQQTQRMDAVGRLAGGVAHEVNNQVTVILGAAAFLLKHSDLPEWARNDVEHIRRAGERSAAVTGQLLAFGRRQILQPERTNLNDLVAGLEVVLRRTLAPVIMLELDLEPDLRTAFVDHGQLTQALLNLLFNARDAMPNGGVLTLATANAELPAGNDIDAGGEAAPGPYVLLRVADTGLGIDPAAIGRIFEPFFTTKPFGQGSGLGLAMVYGMVRQSGGYITVASSPGEGAVFTIYLPQTGTHTEASARVEVGGSSPGPSTVGGPADLVVVVEDEPAVRQLASRALVEEGFGVLEARDGEEALELITSIPTDGNFRLVITDLALPRLGGRELAEELRRLGYQVPVLFMSGYTDQDIERLGLLHPGQDLLRKPFSPESLVQRVRALTKDRREARRS